MGPLSNPWLRVMIYAAIVGGVIVALTACESNPIVIKHVHVLTFEIPKIEAPQKAD